MHVRNSYHPGGIVCILLALYLVYVAETPRRESKCSPHAATDVGGIVEKTKIPFARVARAFCPCLLRARRAAHAHLRTHTRSTRTLCNVCMFISTVCEWRWRWDTLSLSVARFWTFLFISLHFFLLVVFATATRLRSVFFRPSVHAELFFVSSRDTNCDSNVQCDTCDLSHARIFRRSVFPIIYTNPGNAKIDFLKECGCNRECI